jgi:hypothetical protein
MALRFSTALRNATIGTVGMAGALSTGVIEIYTGAQPATANDPVSGTLLGTVTTNGAAFTPGSATNGLTFATAADGAVAKAASNWQFTGLATGSAGWFRFKGNAVDAGSSSTTHVRLDGSIATSGGDMTIGNINVTVGAPNTVDQFVLTYPAQ